MERMKKKSKEKAPAAKKLSDPEILSQAWAQLKKLQEGQAAFDKKFAQEQQRDGVMPGAPGSFNQSFAQPGQYPNHSFTQQGGPQFAQGPYPQGPGSLEDTIRRVMREEKMYENSIVTRALMERGFPAAGVAGATAVAGMSQGFAPQAGAPFPGAPEGTSMPTADAAARAAASAEARAETPGPSKMERGEKAPKGESAEGGDMYEKARGAIGGMRRKHYELMAAKEKHEGRETTPEEMAKKDGFWSGLRRRAGLLMGGGLKLGVLGGSAYYAGALATLTGVGASLAIPVGAGMSLPVAPILAALGATYAVGRAWNGLFGERTARAQAVVDMRHLNKRAEKAILKGRKFDALQELQKMSNARSKRSGAFTIFKIAAAVLVGWAGASAVPDTFDNPNPYSGSFEKYVGDPASDFANTNIPEAHDSLLHLYNYFTGNLPDVDNLIDQLDMIEGDLGNPNLAWMSSVEEEAHKLLDAANYEFGQGQLSLSQQHAEMARKLIDAAKDAAGSV